MGVVVGHAAAGVDHTARDQHVALGEVHLEVAARDRRQEDAPHEDPGLVDQLHLVVVLDVERGGVVGIHQHGVARGAIDRIDFGVDHRVELPPAPGRDHEPAIATLFAGKRHHSEVSLTVGGREVPISAQMRASVLDRVAGLREALDPVVGGNNAGDLLAYRRATVAPQDPGPLGSNRLGKLEKDPPLRSRLTHLARDLGAEHHAALGRRLRATALLFVARAGRQQDDLAVARRGLDE